MGSAQERRAGSLRSRDLEWSKVRYRYRGVRGLGFQARGQLDESGLIQIEVLLRLRGQVRDGIHLFGEFQPSEEKPQPEQTPSGMPEHDPLIVQEHRENLVEENDEVKCRFQTSDDETAWREYDARLFSGTERFFREMGWPHVCRLTLRE